MKHWVRMVVVKVAVVCILKCNHFYYCYYYNPYPVLHNPNPNPKVCFECFEICDRNCQFHILSGMVWCAHVQSGM